MLNIVAVTGRLVADPELKKTSLDVSVVGFTIAVERNYSKDGNRESDFIDITAWRGTADFICKYFQKGSLITIDGAIQTRIYEDKNGNKRKAVEILANNVNFGGSKSEGNTQSKKDNVSVLDESSSDVVDEYNFEDDLPF